MIFPKFWGAKTYVKLFLWYCYCCFAILCVWEFPHTWNIMSILSLLPYHDFGSSHLKWKICIRGKIFQWYLSNTNTNTEYTTLYLEIHTHVWIFTHMCGFYQTLWQVSGICTYETFIHEKQRIQDNKRKICIITQLENIDQFLNVFKLFLIVWIEWMIKLVHFCEELIA